MSEELPEGWARVALDALLEPGGLFDGPFGSNLKTSDYTESGVRVVRLENLANLRFIEEKRTFISLDKYADLRKHTVAEGDILFGSFIDDAIRVCLMPRLDTPAIAKADCFCIRVRRDVIDPRFLVYQLGASATRDALIEEIHGATRPRITTKQLRTLTIELPPIAEQRRIGAKIEVLLKKVSAARERLEGVPLILKRFRQLVLAKAFRGELVPTDVELAAAEEKSRESVGQLLRAIGKDPPESESESAALPEGWVEIPFATLITELRNGISTRPAIEPPGVPILRISAVRPGEVVLEDCRFLPDAEALVETYRLRDRDLLFTRYNGSLEFLGVCGMVRNLGTRLLLYPDKLMRVRIEESLVLPEYLELFFQSRRARDAILATAKSSAGQQGISGSNLKEQMVALAPLAEQRRIVAKVEELFALADKFERYAALALARVERIPQRILARAFSGQLVPTEAELANAGVRSFESAEQLLARAKAELGRDPGAPMRRGRPHIESDAAEKKVKRRTVR